MKSAKPTAGEGSSSRRSQPVRQARTNPTRVSNLRGSLGGRDSLGGPPGSDQPIDIFPAITFFADAVTALPKELVRHFTLFKEVDAKIYAPEDALFSLVRAAMEAPNPELPRSINDAIEAPAPASAPMSVQNSSSGGPAGAHPPTAPSVNGSQAPSTASSSSDPRRQLYQQTAFKIQEMLGSLEEKNHVISTANEALQKQLARIDDVWPHLENEFSDEAKWGSDNHWAYLENRAGNKAAHAERSRREGAAAISAAAQQLADEAAARSDARKQAVQAKKNLKTQHQESDFDDPDGRGKGETTTKKGGGKGRKAADAAASVGLGITNGATNGAPAPQPKRRKVEKPATITAPAERAMATVFGTDAPKAPKAKTSSPRGTPAPDGGAKKRKALPTGSSQAKKRTGPTNSPSAASSPVIGSLPEPKGARNSPAPTVNKPPTASRARNNSIQSTADTSKIRPSSSASNKPNGNTINPTDPAQAAPWPRAASEQKAATKEIVPPPKPEPVRKETDPAEVGTIVNTTTTAKKETPKPEEVDRKTESATQTPTLSTSVIPLPPAPPAAPATVTKSGRASKPSTPALATFQEAQQQQQQQQQQARSRTSRNTDSKDAKRKKTAAAATQAQALKLAATDSDANSGSIQGDDEEGDIDADEPVYCYCNGVSYGEMVACDADGCEREWFHLECVGLKVAPKGNAKWYCEPCKKRLTANGKKVNGR